MKEINKERIIGIPNQRMQKLTPNLDESRKYAFILFKLPEKDGLAKYFFKPSN